MVDDLLESTGVAGFEALRFTTFTVNFAVFPPKVTVTVFVPTEAELNPLVVNPLVTVEVELSLNLTVKTKPEVLRESPT